MADLSWGNFKELEANQESGGFFDSFSVESFGNSANSWLKTLADTSRNYNDLEDAFSGGGTSSNEATQKAYADISNQATSAQGQTMGINNNILIYGGIGAVALYFVMGD